MASNTASVARDAERPASAQDMARFPMRLWPLHPCYLDPRGLVALWGEALLAQAVIAGKTRGYTRHPHLRRFFESPSPAAAITTYLRAAHAEAVERGYKFDAAKIGDAVHADSILATRGQLDYEWEHLQAKLRARAPSWVERFALTASPESHPLFHVVPGGISAWEVTNSIYRPSLRLVQSATG